MTSTQSPTAESASPPGALTQEARAPQPPSDPTADAVAERVLTASLGMMEALSVYAGEQLGWYRSLVDDGPATPTELAGRTATNERYAREWLEQQAVYGILAVEPLEPVEPVEPVEPLEGADPLEPVRRYRLPSGAAEALLDQHSLAYLGALPRMLVASAAHLPELLEAFRSGTGVSWNQLGDHARTSQADLNRPWFEHRLADALHGVRTTHTVLSRPGARLLDVGCGAGWSTIALARAYPSAQVIGVDVDAPSVEIARRNAAAAGLDRRVQFRIADGGSLQEKVSFDAAFAFECIHDMSAPVGVLDAMRRAVRPDGVVIVMDEAVGEEFTAPGDELERLMYGFSLLVCLPDGMSSSPSVGTGTVMRPATLRGYAQQAGFADVEVLPIDDFGFWRFYSLAR